MSRRWRRRFFTLAELMVAMLVLMMIMYALFRTIAGAQRAWDGSRAVTQMHENAALAMDVIAQDLRAMKVSDVAGTQINYSPDGLNFLTSNKLDTLLFVFVTTSGLGVDGSDNSRLAEVGYSLDESTLYRWRTTASAAGDWDFYNAAASSWGASWEDSAIVATGVESVTFTARSDSRTTSTVATTDDTLVLPTVVTVALTLIDEKVAGAGTAQTDKTRLNFSKTIHLNRGE